MLIQIDGNLVSINITAAVNPTIVANMNEIYPIADDTYDNVTFFNAPYHTGTAKAVLTGVRFVLTVPYLFLRNGRYGDYLRHTAEY